MEASESYKRWQYEASGKTFLKPDASKCLHSYLYYIDRALRLGYLRVPTWRPFRLQLFGNGHAWLASKLRAAGMQLTPSDHTFVSIGDFERGQRPPDELSQKALHWRLDLYDKLWCPIFDEFPRRYHWSLMQVEYSTSFMSYVATLLAPLCEQLSRQAVLAVSAEQVATFFGNKLRRQLARDGGNHISTRFEGTCIKHRLGKVGVKGYDKLGRVPRLETTANDMSFFKPRRKVEHRDDHATCAAAPLKKTIYSLIDLREIFLGGNRRHLELLAALDDTAGGKHGLVRANGPKNDGGHTPKGINFFRRIEQALPRAVLRPEFNIRALRRADASAFVPELRAATLARQQQRLRALGLIKRLAHIYCYYIMRLGRVVIAAACCLIRFNIVPALARAT